MHLAWPEPPAWALSPGWEIRCEMYPSRCEICCCCSSGVFHQPDLPAGASMAKQRSIYLAMDLFSSSMLLFVSLVGMRMLNPHHRLHYTTSLQSVTGDCVKSAIKDWYWLIQLWCCSSVLSDCTELRQAVWPASSAPFLLSDHWSIISILPSWDSRLTGVQSGDVPTPTFTRGLQTRTFLAVEKNLLRYSKKDAKRSCCWNLFTQGIKLNFETGVGETT